MYLQIIFGIILIIILILIIWIAYTYTAAYQQTLSITVPFEETYRYVPNLNRNSRFKIDSIQIDITGSLKKDSLAASTITPGMKIQTLIRDQIIEPYKNCLLIQEANMFVVDDAILKDENLNLRRCPIIKNPTVENLSVLFFHKLAPLISKMKAQLVSVKLISGDVKVKHSRYTMSNFTNNNSKK